MPFRTLFLIILLLSVIAAQPSIMLFTLGLVFVSSGPFGYVHGLFQSRKKPVEQQPDTQKEMVKGKNGTG
jgi:hypothetical protein